ncbi:MAG: COQ9 family protein [Rhodobacteraceae bacterium]|nr:COQ9 family protein [Paracoccaceae bacterium]
MAKRKSEQDHISEAKRAVISAALPHVLFDGWSDTALQAAITDSGVQADLAKRAFPRGALDLALGYHNQGDADMREAMAALDLEAMRYSARVAKAISLRLDLADKEAVRRAMAFFALPQNAAEGSRALWHTADAIWESLGDTSRDYNWYTKRMTLSAVYSACVLFWLGDQSENGVETEAFIERRIANVMSFEKTKAKFRNSPLGKGFSATFGKILSGINAPESPDDLPGKIHKQE